MVIPSTVIPSDFNPVEDRIEYFIYDYNNNLLNSDYQLSSYTPSRLNTSGSIVSINIDPEKDALEAGYDNGIIKTVYNFITPELGSDPNGPSFFISEISPSRTEIRLSTNTVGVFASPNVDTIDEVETTFASFKEKIQTNTYFDEFYLNFGDNLYILGINIILEVNPSTSTTSLLDTFTASLLVKLYEPLPNTIGLKRELAIVTKTAESVGYQLEYEQTVTLESNTIQIAPANYNIPVKDKVGPSTVYKTYSDITTTTLSGSLFDLVNNISQSSPTLNVDYTDYDNFVFFSSAKERLQNFRYKLISISSSQAELDLLYSQISGPTSASAVVSSSKLLLEQNIQTTISSFDGYERYLYYDSGSKSWPKSNSTIPYTLVDPYVTAATDWYATQSITASSYDEQNQNNLEYTVPDYIKYNSSNENYLLYTNMIGQFFDEVWLYTKEITSKLDANSSLYQGVSKDLVSTVLESLGTKIYDSSYTLENIYSSLIGLSADGSILPSTGSEMITSYVTSSISSSEVPTIDDFVKLSYKKIYHSLPYLLKKKGTNEGLRALINIFGVPDTILRINEFGGKDKVNTNDWDHWQHQFNYAFSNSGSNSNIQTSWELNSSWNSLNDRPETVQFRFKALPSSSFTSATTQSLWSLDNGTPDKVRITLEYDADFTSGSYSGSIISTENQYATLYFYSNNNDSGSIRLPFINDGWWSVMVTRTSATDYILYAGNKIYNGKDGHQIGYLGSASIAGTSGPWDNSVDSNFPQISELAFGYIPFTGSYQEVRYYNEPLSVDVFKDYVMNPYSIEGMGINSAPDQLAFRASLGGELYTGSVSIHPKVTGSWTTTSSFASDSNFDITGSNFVTNREYIFFDQIPAGIQNAVSNKINSKNTVLPTSSSLANIPNADVISALRAIEQSPSDSGSYTDDINYLEVAFSPQNEINEDINSSIGYFNIGEYIGDPRLVSSSAESYPALDTLRDTYFEKYTHNYNLWDYIRLIRYYDNSLFKMIKDFVPARTSLATGIVIKQHILERNKYPTPQVDTQTTTSFYSGSTWNTPGVFQDLTITGSITTENIYTVTGSNGGTMPDLGGVTASRGPGFNISPITQSWTEVRDTKAGLVDYTASSQHEFFDGELSGSVLTVTTQSLNPDCDVFLTANTVYVSYSSSLFMHSLAPNFLNSSTVPPSGEIYLLYDSGSAI